MLQTYLLKHRKPIRCNDEKKLSKLFNNNYARRVRSTYLNNGLWVRTIFLVFDHNYDITDKTPILFETMVFNFKKDSDENIDWMLRADTWRQALINHRNMVAFCERDIERKNSVTKQKRKDK